MSTAGSRQRPVATARRFRFCDDNPVTGWPLASSRFRDLPVFAAEVVTDVLGMTRADWDVLVEEGTTGEITGGHEYAEPSGGSLSRRSRERGCTVVTWASTSFLDRP